MILISAGLVLTAIVLLIAGFVLAKPFLVMWSIAVSVLSAVFLVIGALLRRHELFPGGSAGAAPPLPPKGPVPAGPLPAPPMMSNHPAPSPPLMRMPQGMGQTATVATQPRLSPVAGPLPAARQGLLSAEAIVLVIPGRKRYHVAGCRQLVGRDHEELTHEEAQEEGFTPCTTCLPEFTGGIQPQDASPGTQKPTKPLTSSQESGSFDTREPGPHEPTGRFTSPYKPVASPVRQEASPVRQEAAAPVARPYIQPPSVPPMQERPQEQPTSPALQIPAKSAIPSFPIQLPSIPEIPPAESEAISWFNRDEVTPPEFKAEVSADLESTEPESAEPESATASTSDSDSGSAKRESSAGPETPAEQESSKQDQIRSESARSESIEPEPEPKSEPAGQEAPATKRDAPEKASRTGASAKPAPAELADETAEPVESAETVPGHAGQPVPVDPTSAGPAVAKPAEVVEQPAEKAPFEDRDDDTSPGGIPVIREQSRSADSDSDSEPGPETVKVIVGTRRFHDSACPLIKGMGGSGVETMSRSEAEEAGLSNCSVCLSDPQTVG